MPQISFHMAISLLLFVRRKDTRMRFIVALLVALAAPAAAFVPSSQRASGRTTVLSATEEVHKISLTRAIKRSTKETFAADVLNPAFEGWLSTRGSSAYPKMKKRIVNKAKVLGVDVPAGFAKKPWKVESFGKRLVFGLSLRGGLQRQITGF